MSTSPTSKLGIALPVPGSGEPYTVSGFNAMITSLDTAAGFTVCTNATRPASPFTGQSIFETDTGDSFIWDGSAWQPGGGGGSIEISATAPASPAAGDLWWDSDNGNLYIYYDDGDSQQWVAANGPQVFVGTTAPAGYQGQLWFDSTTGKVYIYYDDGSSAQWVSAIGGSIAGTIVQVVSTTKTDTFTTSSTSMVDVTSLSATITPSSTSSKIYVSLSIGSIDNGGTSQSSRIIVLRDAVEIGIGDAADSRDRVGVYLINPSANRTKSASWQFLDSPNSISALTYKVQAATNADTLYINRSQSDPNAATAGRSVSTITLMEVAG